MSACRIFILFSLLMAQRSLAGPFNATDLGGRDAYEILEVSRDASDDEIKRAYRKQSLKYHPDRNPGDRVAEERFKFANNANRILSDPEKRSEYDRYGSGGSTTFGDKDFNTTDKTESFAATVTQSVVEGELIKNPRRSVLNVFHEHLAYVLSDRQVGESYLNGVGLWLSRNLELFKSFRTVDSEKFFKQFLAPNSFFTNYLLKNTAKVQPYIQFFTTIIQNEESSRHQVDYLKNLKAKGLWTKGVIGLAERLLIKPAYPTQLLINQRAWLALLLGRRAELDSQIPIWLRNSLQAEWTRPMEHPEIKGVYIFADLDHLFNLVIENFFSRNGSPIADYTPEDILRFLQEALANQKRTSVQEVLLIYYGYRQSRPDTPTVLLPILERLIDSLPKTRDTKTIRKQVGLYEGVFKKILRHCLDF